MNVGQVRLMLLFLNDKTANFMDNGCFLFRSEAAVDVVNVGVTAVAIIHVVLVFGGDEVTSRFLVVESCHLDFI